MLTACLVGFVVARFAGAADEVDQMLNVEAAILKIDAGSAPVKMPMELGAEKPSKPVTTSAQPLLPVGQPKQIVPVPALPDAAQSVQAGGSESNAGLSLKTETALRLELAMREQELARANNEIVRLRDIVQRIQEASRRESLVFHYNMAAIYRASMMYKKAEEEYLAALKIDENDAGVHYNLAILYDDNFKDKQKAKLHYEKFLEISPNDPDAPKVREWLASIM